MTCACNRIGWAFEFGQDQSLAFCRVIGARCFVLFSKAAGRLRQQRRQTDRLVGKDEVMKDRKKLGMPETKILPGSLGGKTRLGVSASRLQICDEACRRKARCVLENAQAKGSSLPGVEEDGDKLRAGDPRPVKLHAPIKRDENASVPVRLKSERAFGVSSFHGWGFAIQSHIDSVADINFDARAEYAIFVESLVLRYWEAPR